MTALEQLPITTLTGDDVITVAPKTSLVDVAGVLTDRDIGAVVVGSRAHVKGIVTERDLVHAVAAGRDMTSTTAADVASTHLIWVDDEATVAEVAETMAEQWVRHILVERRGHLVGIVSARDLLAVEAPGPAVDDG